MRCCIHVAVFVFAVVTWKLNSAEHKDWQVSANFPGGNVRVLVCDRQQGLLRITPEVHPERGWACWWYFRLDHCRAGETITLEVVPGPAVGSSTREWSTPRRIFYSHDNRTWKQTEEGTVVPKTSWWRYRVSCEAETLYLAWGPPFTLQHASEFIADWCRNKSFVERWVLARSEQGREVPAVRITESANVRKVPAAWIQARQHAWECGSSWVAKGLVDWLVSEDRLARELRRNALIVVVPIMDVDNVERGAGGKNQKPQDHNRDWTDNPRWPEVRAAQEHIRQLHQAGQLRVFVDLHNPGPADKQPYFYVPPAEILTEQARRNQTRFLNVVRQHITDPWQLNPRPIESGKAYDPRWPAIAKTWVAMNCGPSVVAVTLEIPWNTVHSTIAGYERIGQQLGRSLAHFLLAS